MLGCDVVAQLHDDAALTGIDDERVLRVGTCRQALLGQGWDNGGRGDGEENREESEQARHGGFLFGTCFRSVSWPETSS